MIRIISRYILRQYLVPLTYILSAFCLMYVIADLFERFPDFVQAKVPFVQVVQYYAYYLFAVNGFVPFIVVILPIVLLLGALYTLTMFARHNELTAMLASGVSIRRMMTPFLFVGFCASVFCAVAQETVGPYATRWISEFNRKMSRGDGDSGNLVKDYFYNTGLTHRQWEIGEFNPRQPTTLVKVKVNQERQDGSLAIEYVASKADYLDGRWWFYGLQQRAFNELGDPLGPITPPVETPQEMAEFNEAPSDFVSELQKPDFLSSFDMMRYLDSRPDMKGPSRTRREVDIFSRLAMPWSCMVMILLSLPATAGGVRRPALRSVAFGLGALFLFYFLLQGGIILGKVGVLEPWLAGWLPNLTFLLVGAALTWRLR